jgi:hypothetical protein
MRERNAGEASQDRSSIGVIDQFLKASSGMVAGETPGEPNGVSCGGPVTSPAKCSGQTSVARATARASVT